MSNLCREAGVGHDSYQTDSIAEQFEAAKANAEAHQPEIRRLRVGLAETKRDYAATVRDLESPATATGRLHRAVEHVGYIL